MITLVDKLPMKPVDMNKIKRDALMQDVLTIIEQNIPLAEITSDYSEHYMPSAIKYAIRRATHRWFIEHTQKLYYDDFEIHRRKDDEGAVHWYIEFKKAVKHDA